jgi:elongation factor P--(R)-beta-lysine ligase
MDYQTAIRRAEIIDAVRGFFRAKNALEVETPVMAHASPTDCHLDVFSAAYHAAGARAGVGTENVYFRTSPEFHMKRLLAAGYADIFQIAKVFRDGERGRLHNPEFTMLEWYRTGMTMQGLMDETAALMSAVLGKKEIVKETYAGLFVRTTGIDPLSCGIETVIGHLAARGTAPPRFATLTDALQFVMAECIEPALPPDKVVFVYHYPADQAVLAAIDPADPRVAKRFEAYCGGMELVNGFEELADASENERRQHEENAKRRAAGKSELPIDEKFIHALENGMPPCSGAALGLDRLIMLALQKPTIDEVLTFPWENS